MRKFLMLAAAGLLPFAAMATNPPPADPSVGDGGVSSLYRWNAPIPEQPGTPLKQAPAPASQVLANASAAQRMLYSSTDGLGSNKPIVVSGIVYLPKGQPPAGGWPILAWAHGTVGAADVCAPSWTGPSAERGAYINAWLKQGYAVVASDYQGLGTTGPHPYLLYRPEGYSILDNVRAALRAYPKQLSNRVILSGQSQGSGAALGAAFVAPDYAPDVNVLGTIATGLVVHVADPGKAPQVPLPPYADPDYVDAAFAMVYMLGTGKSIYPQLNVDDYMSAAGRPLLKAARTGCFRDAMRVAKADDLSAAKMYRKSVAKIEAHLEEAQAFPNAHFKTPVFTATGLADAMAGTAQQYNFLSAMCTAGSTVEWHYYPGQTHHSTVNLSLQDSEPFARRLLAGETIESNCASLHPPGPLQKVADHRKIAD
ncbi:lipase family protein [Solimonas marina]|uniref:Lipase n=1 Tax=Solimonas marina TaxID=2714601 RepID=A0A969WF32_9GAMM|nr:lipase family protein [Solimonas marina]NKF23580.1 lipase [Solimonas marina]